MGYIYLIQTVEFKLLNKNIYKIGRTDKENPDDRIKQYDKNPKKLLFLFVDDCKQKEKEILKLFKENFTQYQENGYENSREYFKGDVKHMIHIINECCNTHEETKKKDDVGWGWKMLGY